jgi:hypothetical protein
MEKKREKFETEKEKIVQQLEKKANRRLKFIFSFIFTQILATQYGTYVAFSWDIIEPVTCLLGIFDLIIAYIFWLSTNQGYEFSTTFSSYVNSRL